MQQFVGEMKRISFLVICTVAFAVALGRCHHLRALLAVQRPVKIFGGVVHKIVYVVVVDQFAVVDQLPNLIVLIEDGLLEQRFITIVFG